MSVSSHTCAHPGPPTVPHIYQSSLVYFTRLGATRDLALSGQRAAGLKKCVLSGSCMLKIVFIKTAFVFPHKEMGGYDRCADNAALESPSISV